jgi:hypothetical protein
MKHDTPDFPIFPVGTLLRFATKAEQNPKKDDGFPEVNSDFTFFFDIGTHRAIAESRKPFYYFSSDYDKDVVVYLGQGYTSDGYSHRHYIEVLHPRLGILCWHAHYVYRLESIKTFLDTFERINTESDEPDQ